MSTVEIKTITLRQQKRRLLYLLVSQMIFWGFPLATIGMSRAWFGGSFILDIVVLVATLGGAIAIEQAVSGKSRDMTREELQKWVSDGMPGFPRDAA